MATVLPAPDFEPDDDEITRLLGNMRAGDRDAAHKLFTIVYRELHRLAQLYMAREREGHTLQPTALANEVYLKLTAGQERNFQNRAHFFAIAARGMREILVDHARSHRAGKRGGGAERVDLDRAFVFSPGLCEEMLAVDSALDRLAELDPRQARVVELRFFAGLTEEEIGLVLGISARTVKREWQVARAWLHKELGSR
jgi:RNA polymerase sigma factor (TIGR02999 family)